MLILQQAFFADDELVADDEAGQVLAGQRGDEEVVFPFRNETSRVEVHPARRDGWIPIVARLFGALELGPSAVDRGAIVVGSVGDQWPSVIEAGLDQIDLVAALRTVLPVPQLPGRWMNGQALGIALPVAPDLRSRMVLGPLIAGKRIVGRRFAIRRDA